VSTRRRVSRPRLGKTEKRKRKRGKQIYTAQIHNLDTKVLRQEFEATHGTT
jgi:hypothetical protein